MIRLTVSFGARTLQVLEPDKDHITIGRHRHGDVVLDNALVSRRHATIDRQESVYTIQDCGAANGVYVNSKRVWFHILQSGDEIQIGKHSIRFERIQAPVEPDDPWADDRGRFRGPRVELLDDDGVADVANRAAPPPVNDVTQTRFMVPDKLEQIRADLRAQREPHLVFKAPDGRTARVLLDKERFLIGSGEQCTIRLPAREVAERHAILARQSHHWFVAALSGARLEVCGVKIRKRTLSRGDTFTVGDYEILFNG